MLKRYIHKRFWRRSIFSKSLIFENFKISDFKFYNDLGIHKVRFLRHTKPYMITHSNGHNLVIVNQDTEKFPYNWVIGCTVCEKMSFIELFDLDFPEETCAQVIMKKALA